MTITEEDIAKAAEYPPLGPAYFASRRIVEKFMASFEAEQFKPLIDEFSQKFRERLWEDVTGWLLMDTESNLHGEMYRMVDACVKALLEGKGWALDKYVLTEKYDGERIRAEIAKHIPRELMDQRMIDLQEEVDTLKERLKYFQDIHR